MKPTIISIALVLSVATMGLYSPVSTAQEHQKPEREFNILEQLDLSRDQKQDIAQIMRQTKQDNGVFKEDQRAQREQLKALMAQDTWDSAAAQSIIEQNMAQTTQLQMNRAIARNKSYLVLNDAQKTELSQIREQGKKRRKEAKRKDKNRMGKGLNLSAEQRIAMKDIQSTLKTKNAQLNDTMREYKHAQQSVVMSDNFNQEAWLALQETMQPTLVTVKLNELEARFQMRSLLTQEQLDILAQRESKQGKRKGKKGNTKQGTKREAQS